MTGEPQFSQGCAAPAVLPRNVLVVDDDDEIRKFLIWLLRKAGYQAHEAADGRAVDRLLAQNTIDLVITDIVMPDREGIETIHAIRKIAPGTKIIAISGRAPYLRWAELVGADKVLGKPFDGTELLDVIDDIFTAA